MTVCPVPAEQQPLRQYEELTASWFFRWPSTSFAALSRRLAQGWLLLLPITLLVASGSIPLRHDVPRLFAAGAVSALVLPLLLLVRQWLGWTYVHRRLMRERITYEESGWYDGQEWEKPLEWREKDLLIAQHQVRPVLGRLLRAISVLAALLLWGASLCQAL